MPIFLQGVLSSFGIFVAAPVTLCDNYSGATLPPTMKNWSSQPWEIHHVINPQYTFSMAPLEEADSNGDLIS